MINLMKDFIDIAASNYYFEIKPLAYTAWKKTLNNQRLLLVQGSKTFITHSVKSKTIWLFQTFLIKSGFYKKTTPQ